MQQPSAVPSKPVVVVDSNTGANNQDQTHKESSKYPCKELLAPANIPNWFLVIVGGVTDWFVFKTLRAIKKQADIMENQAKDARESSAEATKIALATAQAAQKSADAAFAQVEMVKSKERAQLRIEFSEPDFTFNEELGGYPIRYQVFLDGTTRAYIPQNSIFAYMGRTAREKKGISMELHIPRNFIPEMSPYKDYTLLRKNEEGFPGLDTDPGKVEMVEKHNFTVFVDGLIMYRDIFGDEWILEIDRVWVPNSRHAGEGATGSMWVPFSSGIHDTHRKVERKQKSQPVEPPKPN
ncbi:MAG: hypothetical protein ABR991_13510 [Terracidiphilus sp.]